jgi:hypothetical protein
MAAFNYTGMAAVEWADGYYAEHFIQMDFSTKDLVVWSNDNDLQARVYEGPAETDLIEHITFLHR